jgi:hypothetical protein
MARLMDDDVTKPSFHENPFENLTELTRPVYAKLFSSLNKIPERWDGTAHDSLLYLFYEVASTERKAMHSPCFHFWIGRTFANKKHPLCPSLLDPDFSRD